MIGAPMTPIETLQIQVSQLCHSDVQKLKVWLDDYLWQAWDNQIAQDSSQGVLLALAEKAKSDFVLGLTKPL
jgi:hypothetical protein